MKKRKVNKVYPELPHDNPDGVYRCDIPHHPKGCTIRIFQIHVDSASPECHIFTVGVDPDPEYVDDPSFQPCPQGDWIEHNGGDAGERYWACGCKVPPPGRFRPKVKRAKIAKAKKPTAASETLTGLRKRLAGR